MLAAARGGSCLRGILTVLVHSRRANPLALLLLADWVTDGKRHISMLVEELRRGIGEGDREGGRWQQVRAKRLIFQEKQRKVGRTRIQTWEGRQGPSQHCPPLGFLPPASLISQPRLQTIVSRALQGQDDAYCISRVCPCPFIGWGNTQSSDRKWLHQLQSGGADLGHLSSEVRPSGPITV